MRNANKIYRLTRISLVILIFLLTLIPAASKGNPITHKTTDIIGQPRLPVNPATRAIENWQSSDIFHHPVQVPSGSLPVNNEQEENDERENPGDEDDGYKINFVPYEAYDFAVGSVDVSIVQFSQSVLNRTKISLVVLHHSWKSFLY